MKTVFSRYFFSAVIILMLALVLIGTSFQTLVHRFLTDSAVTELQKNCTAITNLAAAYTTDGSFSSREFLVNLDVASQVSGSDAVICNRAGRIILCSEALLGCDHQGLQIDMAYMEQVIAAGTKVDTGVIRGLYTDTRHVVSMPILDPITQMPLGIVIVTRSVESIDATMNRISNIFLFVSALTVLLSVILMSVFARKLTKPLRAMASAARDFGHGNFQSRIAVSPDYPEEVDELARSFNNMATELQKSEYQRKEFVANVSHELKTPMTTIGGYVDGILDGTIPEGKHRYYLRIVSEETKRLSRLVRSMLDISQLQEQAGVPEDKKMRFDMEECVGQVLITFEQKINGKKLDVDVDMPDHPVFTFACRDYVTQIIYNLIDNAVKFSPEGGVLGLSVKEGGSKVYVSVSNGGETIAPAELPLVFDRFHKLDKSRTKNRDGWGLGLYIVKTMVGSHGENISVTSRDGKTTFTFTMPLVN